MTRDDRVRWICVLGFGPIAQFAYLDACRKASDATRHTSSLAFFRGKQMRSSPRGPS